MTRDTLYLLPPGFADRGRREYCPECAEIWGVLAYYPAIREALEIVYQPIDRPRPDLTRRLGAAHQNCPTLILETDSPSYERCGIQSVEGTRFIDNARDIGRYWSQRYGTAVPRGTGPL